MIFTKYNLLELFIAVVFFVSLISAVFYYNEYWQENQKDYLVYVARHHQSSNYTNLPTSGYVDNKCFYENSIIDCYQWHIRRGNYVLTYELKDNVLLRYYVERKQNQTNSDWIYSLILIIPLSIFYIAKRLYDFNEEHTERELEIYRKQRENEKRLKEIAKEKEDMKAEENRINKEQVELSQSRKEEGWKKIISQDESTTLEKKASFLGYSNNKKTQDKMQKRCLETICAFLNSKGGLLFLGVEEGLELKFNNLKDDFNQVSKKNFDGYNLAISKIITIHFDKKVHNYLEIELLTIDNNNVVLIRVLPSKSPYYLKLKNNYTNNQWKEFFYMRNSSSNVLLEGKQLYEYLKERFNLR